MPNTNLPTAVNSGSTGHISNTNIVHEEINRLSRETGRRNIEPFLLNGWKIDRSSVSASGIHLERINNMMLLHIRGLDGTDATSPTFLSLGVENGSNISGNFNPVGGTFMSAQYRNNDGDRWVVATNTNTWQIQSGDRQGYAFYKNLGGYWRTIVMMTDRGWPTYLPPAAV